MIDQPAVFEYAYEARPPGRMGFHRWRWELWQGPALVACGWRTTPADAERALRVTASRRAHQRMGLHPLRPEQARALDRLDAGREVEIDCGAVTCLLRPRREDLAAPARAATG